MTDATLLESARLGDRKSLEALLSRYHPKVLNFGLRVCGNADDADDVAQDSLLAMARSVARFRGDSSLSTWFFTVARRFCLKRRRRSRFAPDREESWEALAERGPEPEVGLAAAPEQALILDETRQALEEAIASLDPPHRDVLLLRDVEGLSNQEVADRLGIRIEAVKSRLHRSRRAVRERLAKAI